MLTIIGLVYLPTTFVAVRFPLLHEIQLGLTTAQNFFSTEFVQTDDNGVMRVAANTWVLAVIALPLTILTIVIWWLCVRFKSAPPPRNPFGTLTQRVKGISWPFQRLRRKSRLGDVEVPDSPQADVMGASTVATWSTTATTLKE